VVRPAYRTQQRSAPGRPDGGACDAGLPAAGDRAGGTARPGPARPGTGGRRQQGRADGAAAGRPAGTPDVSDARGPGLAAAPRGMVMTETSAPELAVALERLGTALGDVHLPLELPDVERRRGTRQE